MKLLISAVLVALQLQQLWANESPVIGIMAMPCSSRPKNCRYKSTGSFIPASYVKWLESGGARAVPIPSGTPKAEIQRLIDNLNGVLIIGGDLTFEPGDYWNTVNWILDYLRLTAQRSKPVPLWATCLGFEAVVCATAVYGMDPYCRESGFVTPGVPRAIDFDPMAVASSVIFGSKTPMNEDYAATAMRTFATKNVSHNSHSYGFYPDKFQSDPNLKGNFTVLGTSTDLENKRFITFIQSKEQLALHWYATQFHPEKSQYIYDPPADAHLAHSRDAVFANQYLAEFFVNECRLRNDHVMDDDMYWDKVIYNYEPWFSAKDNELVSFEQIYIFD